MNWDSSTWDLDLQAWFKTLIHIRRTSATLVDGGYQVLFVEADTLIFQRDNEEETILVILFRGEGVQPPGTVQVTDGCIQDGVVFEELFTHQQVTVEAGSIALPAIPQGAQVWVGKNISRD